MFKNLLYKLAYPLFAKEVEAYHRFNNAITDIHRWCASDDKADLITSHLLLVRDDKVAHCPRIFRERLRALDMKQPVVVTRVSTPESRSQKVSTPEAINGEAFTIRPAVFDPNNYEDDRRYVSQAQTPLVDGSWSETGGSYSSCDSSSSSSSSSSSCGGD